MPAVTGRDRIEETSRAHLGRDPQFAPGVHVFPLGDFALLVPGGFYLAAYLREPTGKPRVPLALSALVLVGIALASFLALFSSEDTSCYEIVRSRSGELVRRDVEDDSIPPTGPRTVESGCSSDTVTAKETMAALAILLVASPAVWWMAGKRRVPPDPPDHFDQRDHGHSTSRTALLRAHVASV